ncbi:Protein ANKUB1 [Collichthys lucidus]|uniref:Protein ANKUB1 n=1 Tax=Collichthys lucidus TaxID=240159 RepID=A0A4U5UIR3_COLLU|nr:Protein ANKUB1 [Collichthys lucidus]
MRVFISFEGSCEPFDIPSNQTVGGMKQMVKNHFLVKLSDDKQVRQYLELSYGGAALQDNWALCDVGITCGSAIRCLIKSEQRPVIRVFNAVTGETFSIMGSEALLHMSVAGLKTVVSMQSGLPVSTFRLSTPTGVQLYDCNQLQDYAVEVGHLDLADWLLERGAHAEEPVGVHPYRQWCHQTAHRDTGKCPIHIAAESNQLLILKLFITKKILILACQDAAGRDPLKIALQCGHRDCVRYLANKLYSVVSLPNMSLSMRIYLQIKRWASLGQKKASSNRCQYTCAAFKAKIGDKLLVDGFSEPNMSSKSRKPVTKPSRVIKAKALHPLPPISNSHLASERVLLQPSSLQSVSSGDFKEMQKKQKEDVKSAGDGLLDEISHQDSSRGKFILPRITSRKNVPKCVFPGASPKSSHFLESNHHCGRTPRENAIYYMTIASFTIASSKNLKGQTWKCVSDFQQKLETNAGLLRFLLEAIVKL